jgi:hypothetical protein
MNALLLLPIRSSMAAGTVGLLGVLYALFIVGKLTGKDRSLSTGEGKFALAALFIPTGIVLFRSMYFYQVDALMMAMVSLALFLSARQVSLFPGRSAGLAVLLEVLALPLAILTALAFTDAFAPANGLAAPMFALIYALMSLDVLRRTGSELLRKVIAVSISLIITLSFTLSVASMPSGLTALLSLAAGAVLLIWGVSGRKPVAVIGGIITAISGAYFGFEAIVLLVMSSSWIDLAVFGASAIALGSLVDRHGVAIKLRLQKWFSSVGAQKDQVALES